MLLLSIRKTWEAKLCGQEYPTRELPYLSQAPLEVMEVLCHHFEENLSLVDESLPIYFRLFSIYHFVQSLQNYVMSQLLTLAWTEFLTELKKNARSLDDLYDIHSNYIHRAKSRLLLTPKSASLMKIIRDALNLALKFRGLLLAANYNYTPQLQSQINSISAKAREYAKFIRLSMLSIYLHFSADELTHFFFF